MRAMVCIGLALLLALVFASMLMNSAAKSVDGLTRAAERLAKDPNHKAKVDRWAKKLNEISRRKF